MLVLMNITVGKSDSGEPVVIEKTVTKVTKTTRYIGGSGEPADISSHKQVVVEASGTRGYPPDSRSGQSPHWADNSSNYEIEVRMLCE